ncbi:MAG: hypothetical protein IKQ60_06770 [Candidatus Methanomethylophilaceae archaeon]|nr:hypothetical protein [Candidatus Methanomethylophilaceae archaeon]
MLEKAEDARFERLMRAVEASPETRASRWLEYGEDEWTADQPELPEFHKKLLKNIGFEARSMAECSL